jgi:hypothetical protein
MEFTEKIDQYLEGSLSEAEKLAFENELNNNAELNQEFSKHYLAKEAIKLAGIRKQVKEVHEQYHIENEATVVSAPKLRKSWVSYISKIAASVAILFVGFGAYQFMNLTPQKLIKENTLTYIEPTMRGEGSVESDISTAYKSADYQKVIEIGNQKIGQDIDDQFLVVMANYNVGNYESTLAKANELLANKVINGKYINELQYYKGLALVGSGKVDEAIIVFKNIKMDSSNPYARNVTDAFLFKLKLLALKN